MAQSVNRRPSYLSASAASGSDQQDFLTVAGRDLHGKLALILTVPEVSAIGE